MNTRYYVTSPKDDSGYEEVSESEWLAIHGDDAHYEYATKVYRGELSIDDVPENLRKTVSDIVSERNARFGTYENPKISHSEAFLIIIGHGMTINKAKKLRELIEQASASLADKEASEAPELFSNLKGDGSLVKAGTRINWNGTVKRAAVDLWDTKQNNPDNAPTLWENLAYREGYRMIPEAITVTSAFVLDECGWWKDTLYKSLLDNNVYNPDQYAAGWEVVEKTTI